MGLAVWGLRSVLMLAPTLPPAVRLVGLVALGVLVYSLIAWREVRWAIGELAVGAALFTQRTE